MDDGSKFSSCQLMEHYNVFERHEVTALLFPEGVQKYKLPFRDIDRKLIVGRPNSFSVHLYASGLMLINRQACSAQQSYTFS